MSAMSVIKNKPRRATASKHPKPNGKGYKGFQSYQEYYKAVILRPAENLLAVLIGATTLV